MTFALILLGMVLSAAAEDHAALRDSLLQEILQVANCDAAALDIPLLNLEADSLRSQIVEQVLTGRRLDHWADSTARNWRSCDQLSRAADLMREMAEPIFHVRQKKAGQALQLPGAHSHNVRRQWIQLLHGLAQQRFMPDSLVIQLEADCRTLYDADDEESDADIFSMDRGVRQSRLKRDALVARLRDPGRHLAPNEIRPLVVKLDLVLENLSALASAFKRSREYEDPEVGRILYRDRWVLIGGTGDNVYTGDLPPVVIDLGGDDIIRSSVAVTRGGFSCYIDLSGDDTYRCSEGPALAIGGVALLVDHHGDDRYLARDFSLAATMGGVSILLDHEGDDQYSGGVFSQAAAILGWALLSDGGGRDSYSCQLYGQAFAGPAAAAVLNELEGDDLYSARPRVTDFIRYDDHSLSLSQGFSDGMRPELPGGVALLNDVSGNDHYSCDIYGQGGAYWQALGALVDHSGNDVYTSWQYAQGAGVHLAAGILLDDRGGDRYISNGVSQGCGHDLAIGWLADGSGDDSYLSSGLSQGAGNANGIGLLSDGSGDDIYALRTRRNSWGYGNPRRRSGSLGLFVDGGGQDVMTGRARQDSSWRSSLRGFGRDYEQKQGKAGVEVEEQRMGEHPLDALFDSSDTVQNLHIFAIWSTRVRHRWQREGQIAHRQLRERQNEYLPWLATQLAGAESWERHGIRETLITFGEESLPWFTQTLDSASTRSRNLLLWSLSSMKDVGSDSLFLGIYSRLKAEAHGNRALCLINLALRSETGKDLLLSGLREESARVRAAAAWGLGRIQSSATGRTALLGALADPALPVRTAAFASLKADTLLSTEDLSATLAMADGTRREIQQREILHLLSLRDSNMALKYLEMLPQSEALMQEFWFIERERQP